MSEDNLIEPGTSQYTIVVEEESKLFGDMWSEKVLPEIVKMEEEFKALPAAMTGMFACAQYMRENYGATDEVILTELGEYLAENKGVSFIKGVVH